MDAGSRISRGLTDLGLAVLRVDFTGLGGEDGEWGNEGPPIGVEDLVQAADFLRQGHGAPALAVGHGLAGAAIVAAAAHIPEVRAVATINAPSDPAPVPSGSSGNNRAHKLASTSR